MSNRVVRRNMELCLAAVLRDIATVASIGLFDIAVRVQLPDLFEWLLERTSALPLPRIRKRGDAPNPLIAQTVAA